MEREVADETVFYGTGNVFADLDLPAPDERLSKAALASAIQDVIDSRGLSQAEAATRMGIDQPKVSKILHGRLAEFSTERLIKFLVKLGADVDIVVRKPSISAIGEGRLRIAHV